MANTTNQQGGVNISNNKGPITVHGDLVGRDKIVSTDMQQNITLHQAMNYWQQQVAIEIDKAEMPPAEQEDIKRQVEAIKSAVVEEKANNPGRLEKLINTIAVMSPDIFDVVVASLADPLAGIGLVIKKVRDKVQIEKGAQNT